MTTSPQSEARDKVGGAHRPSLFIGSSTEGLEFARAARGLLNQDVEITLWNEGFFQLGATFIETLINGLPGFDFAILVVTPDDFVRIREVEGFGPRDNVIFELGLFMGRLGRPRTFLLHQAGAVRIPTDLSGMAAATYDWPRADNNHQAAIAAACDMIRNAIRGLGESEAKVGRNIQRLESRQNKHEDELSRQQAEIRTLQVLLRGMVTKYELEKLKGLTGKPPFHVRYSLDMIGELVHLRAMELIMNRPGTGISTIEQRYGGSQERFDLCKHFYITEHGLEYLKLRDEVISEGSDG
jgi:predicted nucleotide-binding protein with TIR-like domain